MRPPFTPQQAVDAVAKTRGERDAIRASLFDLDGRFGKRLPEGAAPTGTTRQLWDSAADGLVALWKLFEAYSAVIDRAARPKTNVAFTEVDTAADAVHGYQQAVLAIGARRS
jgi:hypothetical protein